MGKEKPDFIINTHNGKQKHRSKSRQIRAVKLQIYNRSEEIGIDLKT
jgi:hypothetical protein